MKIPEHIAASLIAGMAMTYRDLADEDEEEGEGESEETAHCREALEWVLTHADETNIDPGGADRIRAELWQALARELTCTTRSMSSAGDSGARSHHGD